MNVLIVTGERSAENYASLLVDELAKQGDFKFFSICSDILSGKTRKLADYRDMSVIGVREAVGVLNKALNVMKTIKNAVEKFNIGLVILIDFPEFNLKVAKFAKNRGLKVVYYVVPQVWAWRQYRISQLMEYTDLLVPILPFERAFFYSKGMKNIKYFGHPLVDLLHGKVGIHKKDNVILLMPGSRKSEIMFNYRSMFEAASLIKEKYPHFKFVWVYPSNLDNVMENEILAEFDFVRVESDAHAWMDRAYFGILKSGTTTLEATLFGLPMVVVYRLSKFSYYFAKVVVSNVRFISLPNLICGYEVVDELIEDEATPASIFYSFEKVYLDKNVENEMKKKLEGLRMILGEYPVTPRIAKEIIKIL